MKLLKELRNWFDRWVYNRFIDLLYREPSYWSLLNSELPKIEAHYRDLPVEKGITGMYD